MAFLENFYGFDSVEWPTPYASIRIRGLIRGRRRQSLHDALGAASSGEQRHIDGRLG
jgi:hypothetical protein